MIKALLLTTFILLGTPWQKDIEKITPEVEEVQENTWANTANFTITHYCNCAKCCGKWAGGPTAAGVMPEAGRTIAVDSKVIPLGSEVLIGDTIYIAEDTGVKGYWIDIYCNSHSEAKNRGMYTAEVSWK